MGLDGKSSFNRSGVETLKAREAWIFHKMDIINIL